VAISNRLKLDALPVSIPGGWVLLVLEHVLQCIGPRGALGSQSLATEIPLHRAIQDFV
jgi:hypothetical protein